MRYLQVAARVRYWEDSKINGEEDVYGLMPCVIGDLWCPLIDLESGKIINWTKGVSAEINYKVSDAGAYEYLSEDKTVIKDDEGYVPDILCPKEYGHGDYIIMDIDKDGVIDGFNKELK